MAIITFPKILSDRLTDEGAKALADILDKLENSTQKATLEIAEERFERRLAQLEAKIEQRLTQLDAKIDRVAAETKAEIIKWMFIFWVGQVATILAVLFVFFKH